MRYMPPACDENPADVCSGSLTFRSAAHVHGGQRCLAKLQQCDFIGPVPGSACS